MRCRQTSAVTTGSCRGWRFCGTTWVLPQETRAPYSHLATACARRPGVLHETPGRRCSVWGTARVERDYRGGTYKSGRWANTRWSVLSGGHCVFAWTTYRCGAVFDPSSEELSPVLQGGVREYIDRLGIEGDTIGEDHDDDPILVEPEGRAVDSWREDYPYDQRHGPGGVRRARSTRSKSSCSSCRTEIDDGDRAASCSSRAATRPARAAPSSGSPSTSTRVRPDRGPREAHGPRAGPVVLPALRAASADGRRDRLLRPVLVQPGRSGTRDGVLRPRPSTSEFLRQAPSSRRCSSTDGISLVKFWFSVSPSEQRTRFAIRQVDPSATGSSPHRPRLAGPVGRLHRGEGGHVPAHRHRHAPWTVVKSNDRTGTPRSHASLLSRFDYAGKDNEVVGEPDPLIVKRGVEAVGT